MYRLIRFFSVALLGLLIIACGPRPEENKLENVVSNLNGSGAVSVKSESAEVIFYGGDILTMVGEQPEYTESLAIRDGRILALGARQELLKYQSSTTRLVDLQGKTMLPGFFDSHSHFYLTAVKLSTVNLDPPPAGNIKSIDDILTALKLELARHPRKANQWLFGWGYDNGMLKENRHPTKADLDKVSLEVPIAIYHFSGHMLVLNSRALAELGFNVDSIAPQGGVIRRLANSREPSGIIEEQAIMPVLQVLLASVGGERLFALLDESQLLYKRQGFTTILEMAALPPLLDAFNTYAAAGKLDVDLAAAVMAVSQPAIQTANLVSRQYQHRFRVAGAKINLDGGSPGRTAFMREPYFKQDANVPANYRGYSSITQQQDLDDMVAKYYELQIPIFIHGLGDAAIDQAIHAVSAAQKSFPREDVRQQLIHLQVFQPDQMEALKKLDVSLTFQSTHNYYFADFHAANTLGPERTETLCPTGSAWREGFNITIHHDSPVHPVNQLDLIWIATNRTSRSGKLYGPQERLSVYQALQAATINAAWQFFEEDTKGSLAVGKLADLVILDKNPLKMDQREIREIQVLETIKEGRTVWPVSL